MLCGGGGTAVAGGGGTAVAVAGCGTVCRRGELSIIRSICRCVRFKRFSSSTVRVHAALPYSTVGVTLPSKSRRRSFNEYDLVVSSLLSIKNLRHPDAILFSTSVCADW